MRMLAILPALALAACAHGGGASPQPLPMPPASAFAPIERPVEPFDSPLAAAQHYAQYRPGYDGGSSLDLASRRADTSQSLVMVFSVESYADDSVAGEQWRIVIERVPGGWKVADAGVRYKCWRGADPGSWQKELCP